MAENKDKKVAKPKAKKPKKAPVKKAAAKKAVPEQKKSTAIAVVAWGGKQYLVKEGQKLDVEKIENDVPEFEFENVLLVADKGNVKIGKPNVAGAKVVAKIIEQTKGKKIIVFKYKPKKRYRKKQGHRQKLTKIEISKIVV